MKIAFLNIYNGSVERGAEIFVEQLATRLSINNTVCVYQTGEKNNGKYKIQQIKGIPYYPHQGPKSFSFWPLKFLYENLYHLLVLFFTLKCLPGLWRENYDWIIPVNGRWQVLICRLFRTFRRTKILVSGQAGVGFEDRWNMIVGKPDLFVALSPTAYSWAKDIYSPDRIVFIPNGVDTDKFREEKNKLHLSIKKPVVLCVSALLPYKRIELLIRAVSKLNGISLLLIGDGPLRPEIEKLGDSSLKDRFMLITHVLHDEINQYYSYAQVFSLPSRTSEAFGLVYLEALACNIPVVAPEDINRSNIIGEAGYLGDVENADEYAKLLDKALYTDFGNKPRKQAEKFSWENIAKDYEKVFEKH